MKATIQRWRNRWDERRGTDPARRAALRRAAADLRQWSDSLVKARIWNLAGPALAELTLTNITQMISLILVGHLGSASIAAVGLSNQPFFFGLAFFFALNVGSTALIARAIGASDKAAANEAARQTIVLNLMLGVAFSIAGVIFARDIIAIMGGEGEALELGAAHLRWTSFLFATTSLSLGLSSILRGSGDTVTPMRVNVIGNVVAVLLGYPLIYGLGNFLPGFGVVGAAAATGLARATSALLQAIVLLKGRSRIIIRMRGYRWRGSVVARILRVGLPASAEQLIMRTGQIIFVRVVAGLGTEVLAAHQIGVNILGLSFMPAMAFGIAATTLVGQALGAEEPDWAVKVGWEARRICMYITAAMAAVLFFGGHWIARLYTADPAVIAATATALKIIAIAQPAQTTQFVLAGALRGAGDTRWPLYTTAAGMWGFRVALAFALASRVGWGLTGAWIGMAVDQSVRSGLIWFRYRSLRWLQAKV